MLRDQIAEDLDQEAAALDAQDDPAEAHSLRMAELRARAHAIRVRAASDRKRAAQDREQAARDRRQAARDREQAAYDREHAATDELTGARRRGVGLEQLENEMKRARREASTLWAAYVDVDGLKAVNDRQGHAAGDTLLRTVADGLRRNMRSYDLLVRLGGDEFLCVLPNITLAEAQERFSRLRTELKDAASTSVSVGFSELRDGDSPDDLIRRADTDLLARRSA
jgi:diguanylate cyclase (GGDEF)-like protein